MNIGRQWEDRLRIWSEQFGKHYLSQSFPLTLEYFSTMEQLPYATAVQMPFSPVPEALHWGKKWEYGWFHTQVKVPSALQGERLVLFLRVGEEMLVWVNGREAGAIDKKHPYVTLTHSAQAGDLFDIVAECYAGHGIRNEGAGPVADGEVPVPEPPETQVSVRPSFFAVWNETVFQAAMDYQTLYSLVLKLPEKSLRAMKIIAALKEFTCIADFELPLAEMTQSLARARTVLAPLLDCKNGSTAPVFTVFGQSHLDMAWLWPVEETLRKCARTYANQLALMEEYPSYRFLLCEPPIPETLRSLYPGVWERVQAEAERGAILPEGALWIESDTHIPSGESLIRQFVLGKRWFQQEMGVDSKLAWMPDTFGFSGALPQIMQGCRVPFFATQKLLRQDPECEPFPYNLFHWEGIDGSRVLSHIYKKNNANFTPGDLLVRWEEDRIQQTDIDGLLYPFGYGDGGGGPTREMLEMAARCRDLEGAPRCRMESPVRYFEQVESSVSNTYHGELYLAWHRGTLTAQAKTKRLIRKAEISLKQTEALISQCMVQGKALPSAWQTQVHDAWKTLLFHQFHDIAAGASIHRVHACAEQALTAVCQCCDTLMNEMLSQAPLPLHCINLLSYPIHKNGITIPPQSSAILPPAAEKATAKETADGFLLSNAYLSCTVNSQGEITSVQDCKGHEYIASPANRFLLFKDVNTCYDAWEIGSMYERMPVPLSGPVSLQPETDAEGVSILVQRTLHHSRLTQRIFLGHTARRIDFQTQIDWQEKHKLLKVAFPITVYAQEAMHEIQFGYVKRPTHFSRTHDRDQYEVSNQRYTALCDSGHGAAVLNDGKYGVSTCGNEIRLSLLRAPMMPDMTADRGLQQFTYAFYPFRGDFAHSTVTQEAAQLNEPPLFGRFCLEPICVPEAGNIIVETIKPADTKDSALLVRAYEAMGMQTETAFSLHPHVHNVCQTNMLEETIQPLPCKNGFSAAFRPFEIKTFLLHL